MTDFLDTLARDAQETIDNGYYTNIEPIVETKLSLRKQIENCIGNAVITEIKAASPSIGTLRGNINAEKVASAMQQGGAVAISVLTEPKHFNGSLDRLSKTREAVKTPILMKDFFLSPKQIDAAAGLGANAILLIQALYDREYGELGLDEMISYAHSKNLEVLLETRTEQEFASALKSEADLIGINNRNLSTLKIDLKTTENILKKMGADGKIVVSESGIQTPDDLLFLRKCGASAFLIGSSIMLTDNVELKVKEFVNAK